MLRISDLEGRPVAGAQVSLTELRDEFLLPERGWDTQDWTAIGAASTTVRSDALGSAAFDLATLRTSHGRSALWVTHPRHEPAHRVLSAEELAEAQPLELSLTPCTTMTLRVVDSNGERVLGARVEQYAAVPSTGLTAWASPALRVFQRRGFTDAGGELQLEAVDGPMVVLACFEPLSSEPWIGDRRSHLTLRLRSTCVLFGELFTQAGFAPKGPPSVSVFAQRGSVRIPLGSTTAQGDGWGPLEVAVVEADFYGVRLAGHDVRVREKRTRPPSPGDRVRLDLDVAQGLDIWVMAVDNDGAPLSEAIGTLRWEEEGANCEAQGFARSEGPIRIRGAPAGRVLVDVTCRGFQSLIGIPEELPMDPPQMYQYTLQRAGVLEGRVTWRGKPVESFHVFVAPERAPHARSQHSFVNREDGRFTIDSAPLGPVMVLANGPASPGSGTVSVTVPADGAARVEIELDSAGAASGQVVDASSGEPLTNAWVQPYTCAGYSAIAPWGAPQPVDSDGRFELTASALGRVLLRVGAPQRGAEWATGFATSERPTDFGLIALGPPRHLRVQLSGPAGADFSRFSLLGQPPSELPSRTFPASGVLQYSDLPAGAQSFLLMDGAGLVVNVRVDPSVHDEMLIPVRGPARVSVTVAESLRSGASSRNYVQLMLANFGPRAYRPSHERLENGRAVLEGVPPGRWRAQFVDGATHESLAESEFVLAPGVQEIDVRLEQPAAAWSMRATDSRGAPLPSATVQVYEGAPGQGIWMSRTDAAGECVIRGPSAGEFRAALIHSSLGTRFDIPVHLRASQTDPIELRLDDTGSLRLRFVEDGLPLGNIEGELFDPSGRFSLHSQTSKSDGTASWDGLAAGRYVLRVSAQGVWPSEHALQLSGAQLERDVGIRRLNRVELTLRDERGLLIPGVELELTCDELSDHPRGGDVRAWVRAGHVQASSPELHTDVNGVLVLGGVPSGRYRIRSAGARVDVHVQVRGGRPQRLDVVSQD